MNHFIASTLLIFSFFKTSAQENQNFLLSKFSSGNFTVFKCVENGNNFKFEASAKPWPINFAKEGERITEITIKRAGIIEEKYQADLPNYPAYYKSISSEIAVTALDDKLYYYTWSIKTGSSIKYIFSETKVKNYLDEKKVLDDYRNAIKDKQTNARTQRVEENNALAEKLVEENTLKGKKIKSVKLVPINKPGEIGLLTIMSVGVEFELENGKILKTINLGGFTPYTDFDAEVSGGDYAGGDFKVADDSRKIPNDKIDISVWSKFDDKKNKGKIGFPVNYKKDVHYNYQGGSGGSGRTGTVGFTINGTNGTGGRSVKIDVTSLFLDGEKVHKLVISDASVGRILSESKIHADYTLNMNTNGGNGGDGADGTDRYGNGGNGGNGGSGGNIFLSGNGASTLKIALTTSGGTGGVGGRAKTKAFYNGTTGSTGQNGVVTK